jgi:hypothetical protein
MSHVSFWLACADRTAPSGSRCSDLPPLARVVLFAYLPAASSLARPISPDLCWSVCE